MTPTLAFDVYGTLIDTQGVVDILKEFVGENAENFAQAWREKQLEYAFRRGLMQRYQTFAICTEQALEYCCQTYKVNLTTDEKAKLLQRYQTLPAFPDAKQALEKLQSHNLRLFAFSNGTKKAVDTLLSNATIRPYFLDIVSVDDLKSFKPNPQVYQHFLSNTSSDPEQTWLVSSNPFDVIGAISAGMGGIWVQRSSNSVFDPWGIEPSFTIASLAELDHVIKSIS